MRLYDTVCVMSESSIFTALVATFPASVRKVQMIHTHYPRWAGLVKRDIAADERLFKKMDCIAAVGVIGARDLAELMPSCRDKIVPFHNLINQDGIVYREKTPHDGPVRIISLARINDRVAKDGPRMIRVAQRLKAAGLHFIWDNYGGSGNGFAACQKEIDRLGIGDTFRIHPYDPQARAKIAEADLFALLSHYEGLPNVIYESLLSGTPVLVTAVGGILEQIVEDETGWLVDDDEDAIMTRLESLILHKQIIFELNRRLQSYAYDNDLIVFEHEIFLRG